MAGRKYSPERVKNASDALKGVTPWNKGAYKLSEEQIIAINKDSRSVKEIAQEYNVSIWLIYKVKI